jgi:hypothetical protein
MQQISLYLALFSSVGLKDQLLRKAVLEALKNIGIVVEDSAVMIKKGDVYISIHPAGKSELLLHQKELIDFLRTYPGLPAVLRVK